MGVSNMAASAGGVGVGSASSSSASLGTASGVAAAIANSAAAAAADARHQDSLDNILKQMREATELRKELEREHADALSQLREKQAELARSSGLVAGPGGGGCSAPTTSTPAAAAAAASAVAADKVKSYETIEALQSKIRELEKKTELQNVRHEELLLEMAAIKRTAQAAKGAAAATAGGSAAAAAAGGCSSGGMMAGAAVHSVGSVSWKGSRGQEVQTSPESGTSTPDSSGRVGGTSTLLVDSLLDPASRLGRSHVAAGGASAATPSAALPPSATSHHATGLLGGSDQLMASGYMMGMPGMLTPAPATATAGSTATPFGVMGYGVSSATPSGGRLMPQIPSAATAASHASGVNALMAAQYADLDARNSFLNGNLVFSAMQQDPSSQATAHLLTATDTKQLDMLEIPGKGRCFVFIAKFSYDPLTQSPNENPEAELPLSTGDYVLVWGHMDEDGFCDGELLDGRRGLVPSNYIQKLVGDDLLDFHQSAVQGLRAAALDCDPSAVDMAAAAGQHVDDIASAAHDVVMMAMKGFGGAKQRLMDKLTPGKTARRFLPRLMATNEALAKRGLGDLTLQELEDILEEEDENFNQTGEGPVPPPKQLSLERQLHKSVLISWAHPDGCPPAAVDSYHVYVDGVLKTTVKATERPRALVEGVDSMRPHRISVRSITPNRRTSRDAACTMVVGKDIPQAPSNVKAGNVTSTSAVISWLPANSNHQHVVCVNNVEVRTVKPGVYRHTITGLAPNTVYRVTVRAKNIRQQTQTFDEKTSSLQMERCSAHIDFRTLPKGLPDPPVDIQVEAGPQDGTLLVTWLPVAGHGGAHANGAPVTGYAVYADGKKVTDVDSPTGDHALIDINKLLGLNPKQVTVRTKSRDSQSSDSLPTAIPGSILRKGARDDRRGRFGMSMGPLRHHPGGGRARLDAHGQLIIEPDENLSDKEVYPNHMNIPAIEITKDSASEANFSEDDYLERRGRYGHHMAGAGPTGYTPRSHAERGRPPPLPHERAGRMGDYGPRDPRREERDRMYSSYPDDPRGRHGAPGERGYRGSGPRGPGGSAGPAGVHHSGLDKRARWFMALFDYDPAKDSPNPDACEEELTFNQGDTIKVYGEKDADGFYWGEFRGRRGYVPHNMVMEVQDGGAGAGAGSRGDRRGAHGSGGRADRWGDIYERMPVKRMIALYDYDPQELSPNVDSEVELSFNTGNIIYVYGDMDDDGFYMGELDGTRGLVPSNFLTEAPADYEFEGGGRGPRGGRGGPMGPGARGPPPPPRDGRMDPRAMDRRKGSGGNENERRSTGRQEKW